MQTLTPIPSSESANERLKQGFSSWLWTSMILGTALHFALFLFWPTLTAATVENSSVPIEMIAIPDEVDIPPPPERLTRPALPVISDNINDQVTIEPTTWVENPVNELPPPPTGPGTTLSAGPTFTPYTVAPVIQNRDEIVQTMERVYPSGLREAGIGGTVRVWFLVDEAGSVQDTRIEDSSGYQQLDEAALSVAEVYRFLPALNRDQIVPVWVAFSIVFRVR